MNTLDTAVQQAVKCIKPQTVSGSVTWCKGNFGGVSHLGEK